MTALKMDTQKDEELRGGWRRHKVNRDWRSEVDDYVMVNLVNWTGCRVTYEVAVYVSL